MTNQHPITPPPELVEQWYDNMGPDPGPFESFAIAAARWGADQELEACCEWLGSGGYAGTCFALRAARRPKPPSLKEEALKALDDISIASFEQDAANVIRRALEQLTD